MSKTTFIVELNTEAKKILEKRAKKQYLSLRELISDILRRSVLSSKNKTKEKKTDDMLVNIFSKSRRGRKKKKRAKKS